MSTLVTGVAGFIGMHTAKSLLSKGHHVVGIDNLNHYYDPRLKEARLTQLERFGEFRFLKTDFATQSFVQEFTEMYPQINQVIHLGAQAGVRNSIDRPQDYMKSNLAGQLNILECCRNLIEKNSDFKKLIYASSSSVYGANAKIPFSTNDTSDHPVSFYGATKKACEVMTHSYASLYKIPSIGLRFFTVYGPWGRPDMSPYLFTKSILDGEEINVFNNGNMRRDFTYIDDIVKSIIKLIYKPASSEGNSSLNKDPSTSWAPYRIFNIGNSKPTSLMQYIEAIENELSIKAICNFMDLQPGDVQNTFADTSLLKDWIDYRPTTKVEDGIKSFVKWYRNYYKV